MKRQDVINNIQGSNLKKQFLEAFLLQSAFIESLLKQLIEDDFFQTVIFKVITHPSQKSSLDEPKQITVVKERLLRQNLFEIIEYLVKVGVIDPGLKTKLHTYREKRNGVLHDLVGKMSLVDFEAELEGLVSMGTVILDDQAMVKASQAVQRNEEFRLAIESGNSDEIQKVVKKYSSVDSN